MSRKPNNQPIEVSLELIAASAEPNWSDNWNFRSYLIHNIDPKVIDQTVLSLYKDVTAKIDCTTCGNCCREIHPFMTPDDIDKMADGLNIARADLLAQTKPEEYGCVSFKEKPCPMLKENKCTIYQFRPRDCAEYPHLDKPDFLAGSIGTIENYGTCPIVYNVYNQLKQAFSYDPTVDYIGDTDPEQNP